MECTLTEEIETIPKSSTSVLAIPWTLYIDGSSNTRGTRVELILANLDSIVAKQALCFSFKTSNNEAEYEVLLTGLRLT